MPIEILDGSRAPLKETVSITASLKIFTVKSSTSRALYQNLMVFCDTQMFF